VRSSSSFKSLQQTPSRRSCLSHLAGNGGVIVPLAPKGHTGGLVFIFPSLLGKETAAAPLELDSEAIPREKCSSGVAFLQDYIVSR
jgi:hypothetical protein